MYCFVCAFLKILQILRYSFYVFFLSRTPFLSFLPAQLKKTITGSSTGVITVLDAQGHFACSLDLPKALALSAVAKNIDPQFLAGQVRVLEIYTMP